MLYVYNRDNYTAPLGTIIIPPRTWETENQQDCVSFPKSHQQQVEEREFKPLQFSYTL